LKWAFGFPGDLSANAQPVIAGGRVFVGSDGGVIYSLSAATGCIHWYYRAANAVRAAITIAAVATSASTSGTSGSRLAAFAGDSRGQRLRARRRHRYAAMEDQGRQFPARARHRIARLL
jgi:outer membrane protein assembly factor BamB